MNISLLSEEIDRILRNADRPEFTLMQKFEAATPNQKDELFIAMIGKLIAQERILNTQKVIAT